MFDRLIGAIAPHSCLVCGSENNLLCGYCRPDALSSVPSRCYKCHTQTEDFATCKKCRRFSKLSNTWVRTQYHPLSKGLVHKLKFERTKEAASVIAGLIGERLPFLPESIVVTYAPTATSRRRQRGYDQAELIARSLAKQLGLRFEALLARHGQSRQVGASRKLRLRQLNDAFRPINADKINSRQILIVDDVITTGVTLEMAAESLRQAGAKKLYGAAFAQKL